jgi:hypothetical protein
MNELHYARFDVKAESLQDLENGVFKVLEVNGFNAEPVHFYATGYGFWNGWKDLLTHYTYAGKIARHNIKRRIGTAKPDTFVGIMKYLRARVK